MLKRLIKKIKNRKLIFFLLIIDYFLKNSTPKFGIPQTLALTIVLFLNKL